MVDAGINNKIVIFVVAAYVAGNLLPDAFTALTNITGPAGFIFTTLVPLGIGIYMWKKFSS